jgi:hypothetical protein
MPPHWSDYTTVNPYKAKPRKRLMPNVLSNLTLVLLALTICYMTWALNKRFEAQAEINFIYAKAILQLQGKNIEDFEREWKERHP